MSLELRQPSEEDAPAIRGLLRDWALESIGEEGVSEEEIRSWFALPDIWMRVAEEDGRLVGYVDAAPAEGGYVNVDVRSLEPGVADTLVAAATRAPRPADAVALRGFVQGGAPVTSEAFKAAGWKLIRHGYQMRIQLTDDIPEPSWPDGFSPRTFRPGEEQGVYEANQEAFADAWGFHRQEKERWRTFTVDHHDFDPSLWWLVDDGDEVAAFTLNFWHFSGDKTFGWVGILGTRPPWRRLGLATALLLHSFHDFRRRGATKVGLGVDAENTTGAVKLYESAGMTVERRNDTYELKL